MNFRSNSAGVIDAQRGLNASVRVLVVEDSTTVATILRLGLESKGMEVSVVGDGHEAVRATKLAEFDVVLLDQLLPGLTGLEFLARFREMGCTAPVIMVSALSQRDLERTAFAAGASAYITKPIDLDDVIATIDRVRHSSSGPR